MAIWPVGGSTALQTDCTEPFLDSSPHQSFVLCYFATDLETAPISFLVQNLNQTIDWAMLRALVIYAIVPNLQIRILAY